jgi:hypothetical protein
VGDSYSPNQIRYVRGDDDDAAADRDDGGGARQRPGCADQGTTGSA